MSQLTRSRRHAPGQAGPPLTSIESGESGRGQRGLTLVELMIAVLVASVLVGFVFEIQGRMSNAFRSQTNIGALQQGVRAANELIARDARLAGFMMPNGARVSSDFTVGLPGLTPGLVLPHPTVGTGNFVPPLAVFDNPDTMPADGMEPDRVHIFYADPNPVAQTVVQSFRDQTSVVVADPTIFQIEDLVLFTRRDPTPIDHPLGEDLPKIVRYSSCIVKLTDLTFEVEGPVFHFTADAPFNTASNDHCFVSAGTEQPAIGGNTTEKTQVFRLIARAYRIDTTRLQAAPLERSDTGGLRDDWEEIGTGFVDLQISRRFVEETSDSTDSDGDGDPRMDWFSIDPPNPPPIRHLTQLGVGLVARPARGLEGVRATVIPVLSCRNFVLGCNAPNNPFGNANGPKNRFRPEYNPGADVVRGGDYVYRQSMSIVDIRNLGVSH